MTTTYYLDSLAPGLCRAWMKRTGVQSCEVIQWAVTLNFEQFIQWDLGGVVYFFVCFGLSLVYSGVHISTDLDTPELARENWPSSSGRTACEKEYIKPTSK